MLAVKLFIQRHGKAGDGYPDEIRELTDRGCREVRQVAENSLTEITKLSMPLLELQASPLVRAQQTANIVADVFSFSGQITINDCLTPWSVPQDFLNSLDDSLDAVFAASHQPFVGELVTYLTGERAEVPTSTLFGIELNYPAEGGGQLLWYLTPQR